jgi:hypothetical protein
MTDLRRAKWHEIWSRVTGDRLLVYDELLDVFGHDGCTGSELAAHLRMSVLSVRPRLCELRKMGLAEETGLRRGGEHVMRAVEREEAEQRHGADGSEPEPPKPKPPTPAERLARLMDPNREREAAVQLNLF